MLGGEEALGFAVDVGAVGAQAVVVGGDEVAEGANVNFVVRIAGVLRVLIVIFTLVIVYKTGISRISRISTVVMTIIHIGR